MKKLSERINNKLPEPLQNPRTKALIFFGFYAIFFIFLFVLMHSGAFSSDTTEQESTTDGFYQLNAINQNNYHFQYVINEDDSITTMIGDRYGNRERFTLKNDEEGEQQYFYNDGIFLVQHETWELTNFSYPYASFLDAKEINRLVKNSTFLAKTEYVEGDVIYQYAISTTTLLSLLEDIEVDLMDEVNQINLYTKEDEVYKIELLFTPYLKYKNPDKNELIITMEYTDFGNIEEIELPKMQ